MQSVLENLNALFAAKAQVPEIRTRLEADHVLLRGLSNLKLQVPGVLQGVSKRDKTYKLEAGRAEMLILPVSLYSSILDVSDISIGRMNLSYAWGKHTMDGIKRGTLACFIGKKRKPGKVFIDQGIIIQRSKAFELLDEIERKVADFESAKDFGLVLQAFVASRGGEVIENTDGSWSVKAPPSNPEQNPTGPQPGGA